MKKNTEMRMEDKSFGTISYIRGKIPTRCGVALYSCPGPTSIRPKVKNKTLEERGITHIPDQHSSTISSLREATKKHYPCPTPDEECFRAQQINKLRETCEEACTRVIHTPLPKDLFDRYQDPIFPSIQRGILHKILLRELFGDIIGRLIPKNKQGSIVHVIPALSQTLQRCWTWLGLFYQFARDSQSEFFFRVMYPSPLSTFEASSSQPVSINFKAKLEESSSDWSLPVWCLFSWVWWLERTRSLIRDHTVEWLRYTDTFETNYGNVTMLETYFLERSNLILRNLMTAIYPMVYIFLCQTADEIIRAIETYQGTMCNYVLSKQNTLEKTCLYSIQVTEFPSPKQPFDDKIVLTYKNDSVACRRSHFEKYIRLYLWNLNLNDCPTHSSRDQSQETTKISIDILETVPWPLTELNLVEEERHKMLQHIFVMLKRYSSIIYNPSHHSCGGNMHAAAPETVFHYLQKAFNVEIECFASPNNCFFPNFFSAFFDTDQFFGSLGSFFDICALPSGAYEVGPPYTEEVLLLTINHIESILSHLSPGTSVTFFLFVPDWVDCHGLKRMKESRWCISTVEGHGYEHLYVIGTQHLVSDMGRKRYYKPPHNTLCFIFQNDEARRLAPITNHVKTALSQSMKGFLGETYPTQNEIVGKKNRAPQSSPSGSIWWNILTMTQTPITSLFKTHSQRIKFKEALRFKQTNQEIWRVPKKDGAKSCFLQKEKVIFREDSWRKR